jgi:hypothetical protein
MEHKPAKKSNDATFTRRGAVLGFVSYLIVALFIWLIFK